ncbi:hypothetical protein DL93DRAFT_2086402, partial [Clavulina sp. PMI_390]
MSGKAQSYLKSTRDAKAKPYTRGSLGQSSGSTSPMQIEQSIYLESQDDGLQFADVPARDDSLVDISANMIWPRYEEKLRAMKMDRLMGNFSVEMGHLRTSLSQENDASQLVVALTGVLNLVAKQRYARIETRVSSDATNIHQVLALQSAPSTPIIPFVCVPTKPTESQVTGCLEYIRNQYTPPAGLAVVACHYGILLSQWVASRSAWITSLPLDINDDASVFLIFSALVMLRPAPV